MKVIAILRELFLATLRAFFNDKASRWAAALSYYTLFALIPLLLLTVNVANVVLGEGQARRQILAQAATFLGQGVVEDLSTFLEQAAQTPNGELTTLVSIATLLWGASGVFAALQDALNTIWSISPPEAGTHQDAIMALLLRRLRSFLLVVVVGFLLLVSTLVTTGLSVLEAWLESQQLLSSLQLPWFDSLATLVLTTVLFATLFKVLPDTTMAWRDVWLGAGVTALLFGLGQYAITQYLRTAGLRSTYGAAGSIVILLIWVYYSAQIVFLGAEFVQVYATRYGSLASERRYETAAAAGS